MKTPAPVEKKTAHHIADERQSQLKLLIAKGKEQGYLTYAEVNDHLPSEIVPKVLTWPSWPPANFPN